MKIITSSNMPSGATVDLSTSYSSMVVFLNDSWRLSLSIVSLVITFIAAPKSLRVLETTM